MAKEAVLGPRVVRSRSHQVVCLLAAAFCMMFVVGGAAAAFGQAHPASQIVMVAVFLLLAAAAVRWAFASVLFDYPSGVVVVRNPLRSFAVAWPDVVGFEEASPRFGNDRHRLIKVRLTDGSLRTCVGVCAFGDVYSRNMRSRLDEALKRRPPEKKHRRRPDPGQSFVGGI